MSGDTEAFVTRYGYEPVDDDAERASCPEAGTIGHYFCGECEWCGYPKPSCRCAPWKRITNLGGWIRPRLADNPSPSPKGPATMPQQLIYEMNVTVRPGESTTLRIPVDGNVISIAPLGDGSAVQIAATVNAMNGAECDGPYEDRVLWCGRGGQALPTMEFAGYDKRYVGSVRLGTLQIWHFWEMREMRGQPAWDDMTSPVTEKADSATAPDLATRLWDTPYPTPDPRSEMMAPERLDEIADQLAAADPDHGTIGRIERVWVDCTREELSWLFANINDIQELARARKIRARLLLSMPK